VTLASPAGGHAPLDPSSIDAAVDDPVSRRFLSEQSALWESTIPLASLAATGKDAAREFDAIFFPGGHGPVFDLATDPDSQALVAEFAAAGKVVAAVCHGPAALLGVKDNKDGDDVPFLRGRAVTGLSNEEERAVGADGAVPFLLEDKLVEAVGPEGRYEKADEKWAEKVVVDGKLITGQNPASAKGVAEAIVKAIAEQ
jgi:putative intracellular protease/amidase